jgi:hypothetical protein
MIKLLKRIWSFLTKSKVNVGSNYSFTDTAVNKKGRINVEVSGNNFYMQRKDLGVFEVTKKTRVDGVPITTLISLKTGMSFSLHDDAVNALFFKCHTTLGLKLIERIKAKE